MPFLLQIILSVLVYLLAALAALVIIFAPYLYLTVSVFPWLCMHPTVRRGRRGDRGVRRVVYPDGRGVVYTPDPAVRRYLSQYAIFTHEGGKYIRCAIDERIAYLKYDVLTFDIRGRLLDIVAVDERPEVMGQTHAVRLPTKTAYARLLLRQVDALPVDTTPTLRYDGRGMLLLTVLNVLTTVVYALVLQTALAMALPAMDAYLAPPSAVACVLVATLLGLGLSTWVIFRYHKYAKRVMNR